MGVCRPVPNSLPYFRPKKATSNIRFQTWPLKSMRVYRPGIGRNYVFVTPVRFLRTLKERFFKIHFEFAYYSFNFVFIWMKRQIRSYIPVSSFLETIPDFRPKRVKFIPVFRPNSSKTIRFRAAHTYVAYIREYLPGPSCSNICNQRSKSVFMKKQMFILS